jgi:hypothetical protein
LLDYHKIMKEKRTENGVNIDAQRYNKKKRKSTG